MASPVVIIGAPRSGTNRLRDVLCTVPGYGTWPCDEINYIWRHENVGFPSGEFTPEQARPDVTKYIRKAFDKQARHSDVVVEETCANLLRVPFVTTVIPDAKYIFNVRDGLDVVGSAIRRWTAALGIKYLACKARFVPKSNLPYYGSRYFVNRIYRLFSSNKRLAFWGSQPHDMPELLERYSLEQVCAIQWKRCVDHSANAFHGPLSEQMISLRYEDFVADASSELLRVLKFLGSDADKNVTDLATDGVRSLRLGKGCPELLSEVCEQIFPLISDTQAAHKYA